MAKTSSQLKQEKAPEQLARQLMVSKQTAVRKITQSMAEVLDIIQRKYQKLAESILEQG